MCFLKLSILIKHFLGESSIKYKPNLLKLLGRLTVGQPKEPVPWNCYGKILVADTDSNSAAENQGMFVKGCNVCIIRYSFFLFDLKPIL